MKKLMQVLFWSVISAAFIGPGTITTAASAGTNFGYSLLWALLFSTIACLVLQEASARITVVTGQNLGQAIRKQYIQSTTGTLVVYLVLGSIILGCAAYEAGNILGGVAGAVLGTGMQRDLFTIIVSAVSGLLLFFGSAKIVARILGIVVGIMGVTFLVTAVLLRPSLSNLIEGSFLPLMPAGSGLFILGLIGTTVVPYNIFLGSGIARGQKLSELRFGLSVAIILGGIISMGVLVVGTAITGNFSYNALSDALSMRLGSWAGLFFAIGLFSAGFSSAITAPLAAAVTARSLLNTEDNKRWHEASWRYRSVWMGVLTVGFVFGLTSIKPIPAIILAQALNGLLLPFIAIFLFIVVNDFKLMGKAGLNGAASNIAMSVVTVVTILLGVTNLGRAAATILGYSSPDEKLILTISITATILLSIPIARSIIRRRTIGIELKKH